MPGTGKIDVRITSEKITADKHVRLLFEKPKNGRSMEDMPTMSPL